MRVEQRLQELGIELPPPVRPLANYVRTVQTGNLLFISGTGPTNEAAKGWLQRFVGPVLVCQAYYFT